MNTDLREAQDKLTKEFKETYCNSNMCPNGTSCWQALCNPHRCSMWDSCLIKETPQCHTYGLFMSRNAPKYQYHYDIKTGRIDGV